MKRLLTLIVLLALIGAVPVEAQDEPITSATPQIVETLRADVVSARRQVDQEALRLERYREMERDARGLAEKSRAEADRKSWLDSAAGHARRAEALEQSMQRLRAKADDDEARANRLEAALKQRDTPKPPSTGTAATMPPRSSPAPAGPLSNRTTTGAEGMEREIRVEDVLGFWQTASGVPVAFVIVPAGGPDAPATADLLAYTDKRIWKGTFKSATSGPVVTLTYAPKADEMNPQIPEWARRASEGKLTWRVELSVKGELHDLALSGKWYAGEVRWKEGSSDASSVEVKDEKDPFEFVLELNHATELETLEAASLSIKVGSAIDYDPEVHPPEALTMGQSFSPLLSVPAEMAKRMPNRIVVEIKAVSGAGLETVELIRGEASGTRPALYRPTQPVMIYDDCASHGVGRRNPGTLSKDWVRRQIFGDMSENDSVFDHYLAEVVGYKDPGPCLQLEVNSGDSIRIGYDDMAIELPLYKSWVQNGIARHKVIADRLRAVLETAASGRMGGESVEPARRRLRMLDNYEQIVASANLADIHRFDVGDLYFGDGPSSPAIILMEDSQFLTYAHERFVFRERNAERPTLYNDLAKAALEGLSGRDLTSQAPGAMKGVQWTSPQEEIVVHRQIAETRDEMLASAVANWVETFTFGAYDGIVTWTPAGGLWLVATGTNHRGEPQDKWTRLFAAVQLTSSAVLSFAGSLPPQAFASRARSATLGRGLKTESVILADAARNVEEGRKGAVSRGVPNRVPTATREKLSLKAASDPPQAADAAMSCATHDDALSAYTLSQVHVASASLGSSNRADLMKARQRVGSYVTTYWGPNAKFVGGWSDTPIQQLQSGPTCQGMAANFIALLLKGLHRTEAEARHGMRQAMMGQVIEFDMMPGGLPTGRRERYGTRKMDDLVKYNGFTNGFDNLATRDYLRSMGFGVTEIPPLFNRLIKLRHIWSGLQKGYGVKVAIDFAKRTGSTKFQGHAVAVTEMLGTVDATGRTAITAVRVYDSNVGRILEVPAREFEALLARDWKEGIVTFVRIRSHQGPF
jgi:hypothetical protein